VERLGHAARLLLDGVLANESAVRAMIAGSITRPADAARRPGHRFGLIDAALAPAADRLDPAGLAQLRRDLAVVVSAEALFTLTDLCGLSRPDAVRSAVHTACALTEAAFRIAGDNADDLLPGLLNSHWISAKDSMGGPLRRIY
jgi:hypothetical protein